MLGLICCLSGGFNRTEETIPGQGREMSLCFLHVLSVQVLLYPSLLGLHHISLSLYFWVVSHPIGLPVPLQRSGPWYLRSALPVDGAGAHLSGAGKMPLKYLLFLLPLCLKSSSNNFFLWVKYQTQFFKQMPITNILVWDHLPDRFLWYKVSEKSQNS